MGSDLPGTPPPVVRSVVPDSGRSGDTIVVSGTGFGATRSSGAVRIGGADAELYAAWSDTAIVTVVPAGATSGPLTVTAETQTSNAASFKVLGPIVVARSFAIDVLPRLTDYGCLGCHGGGGGLFVDTQAHLLQGGSHGPAVVPGDAEASILVQKLSASPPFGSRMPQGGPFLADTTVQVIRDWINQGALDN